MQREHDITMDRHRRVPRILLAGGQCSGKSKMMREIARQLERTVQCVPEVSSVLRESMGICANTEDREEVREFQYRLYRIQKECERLADTTAYRRGKEAVVFDRGTLCGAVYLQKGYAEWSELCKTLREREYKRYDLVLYLEQADEETYNRRALEKDRRPSAYPLAVERAIGLHALWKEHPRFRFIPYKKRWDEKMSLVLFTISEFLTQIAGFPLEEPDTDIRPTGAQYTDRGAR